MSSGQTRSIVHCEPPEKKVMIPVKDLMGLPCASATEA